MGMLNKNCKGCKCSICRFQGTDNCLHGWQETYGSYCYRCNGKKHNVEQFINMSWECKGFQKKEGVNFGNVGYL